MYSVAARPRFKNEREEALTEAMIEEVETALARCGNSTNRENEFLPAGPDRCRNGTHIGAEIAPEKLEVETEELRKRKGDSRSAAAGAVMQTSSPAPVISKNEGPASRGAGLYQQADSGLHLSILSSLRIAKDLGAQIQM